MRRLADGLRLGLFAVFFASAVFAQRDLATLVGTVTDPSGGVVANAKVTITEDATGLSYEVTSSGEGEYIRPLLKPGTYTVTFTLTGLGRFLGSNQGFLIAFLKDPDKRPPLKTLDGRTLEHPSIVDVTNNLSGWLTVSSPRGEIEARAMVTRRLRPLQVEGRTIHQIGVPFHCSYSPCHFPLSRCKDDDDSGAPSPNSPLSANSKSPLANPCRYSSGINSRTCSVWRLNNGSTLDLNRSSRSLTRGTL